MKEDMKEKGKKQTLTHYNEPANNKSKEIFKNKLKEKKNRLPINNLN